MSTGVQQSNPSAEFPYTKSVYKAIVDAAGPDFVYEEALVFNDEGVWATPMEGRGTGWHPHCEVVAHGGPNPLETPWLRFPFNARQLAALLVDGWGYFIRDFYGEWEDGPNEEALGHIGVRGHLAREALIAAYDECRKAIALAPKLDASLELAKNVLYSQCRRAESEASEREKVSEPGISREEWGDRRGRAKQSIRDLDQQFWLADQAADDAWSQWRAAVVQHLLLPVHKVPDKAFESEQLRALPADRRAEALWQQLQFSDFQDSEERRAQWALICERFDLDGELRRWQSMNPQGVSEALSHEAKVKELNARLQVVEQGLDEFNSAPLSACNSTAPGLAANVPTPANRALLATRAQLCEAFKGYGLQRAWFDDLNSRKWLLNARKVVGQGRRGAVIEPMFCPFAVMNGLVHESRKSHLTQDAGWRILESRFPEVYEANSIGDPREPTG